MGDSIAALLLAGSIAGAIHVLSGPDHLVAVAPYAIRGRGSAWIAGLQWGLGHTTGVLVVGALAWALRSALPLERLSGWSEQVVGFVLVGIGLVTLRAALRARVHLHEHEHGGVRHVHFHAHSAGERGDAHGHARSHRHTHAAFGIGALHGVAGGSHFVAVLPALAFPTTAGVASYLAGYGAGSIVAMLLFAVFVGRLTTRVAAAGGTAYRNLLAVSGVLAILVGLFWIGS
ncbi:MAG: sulfite exporter TauE/SafE family protein [Candidatus Latescibacterota bacterium]|nr:MAG: sulfite exporter TauE/SafE family protein [Candidatus Latescibacterota bacterium]